MARHVRHQILDRDGLMDGGTGRATTAAKEVLRLVAILQATIERSDIAPAILYPGEGDDSVVDTWQAGRPFLIVMAAPNWREIIQRWGRRVVGLDGLYKATKHGLPLYALVASDDDGHTWPIATALLGDDEWAPTVMIDKDARERAAIDSVGLSFALCDFHVQQAWRRASTRFSEDWEAALENLKETAGPGFWSYFATNWLSDVWVDSWRDLGRLLQRDVGLENTNNATESLFKQLSYIFLNRKKAVAPDSLVLTIVLGLEAMGEATLIKHLETVDEVAPHLYTISTYHVNIDLGTCSCPYRPGFTSSTHPSSPTHHALPTKKRADVRFSVCVGIVVDRATWSLVHEEGGRTSCSPMTCTRLNRNRWPATSNRNRRPATSNRNRRPATSNQNRRPATSNRSPPTSNRSPLQANLLPLALSGLESRSASSLRICRPLRLHFQFLCVVSIVGDFFT